MVNRRERLDAARLYLVCDAQADDFLTAALSGGVDIVQLRMKHATDDEIVAAGQRFVVICQAHGALLILNDRPELVAATGADGVHVGQGDVPPEHARSLIGDQLLVGLSTHTPTEVDTARDEVDYIGVGPVHATPTKPGRPAVGLDLVTYASRRARIPFFAIGGINRRNVDQVRAAGAQRIAVVRALTGATDPRATANQLRAAVTREHHHSEARVGAA